ncbi:hypothetical protein OHB56_21120 [Streptomyces sp. NBC_01635]|uniref:DUF6907 domain-containing protein n=1 Tax=Streptomyces sp. NBC_01635 TaxID=2975904 RepID=UPI003867D428|nr:hypothetical protein OHB56_21120 [Streptomyces sp. NBC_01635]
MQHNVQPTTPPCGARRTGWERPGPGRRRLPCILPAGHNGDHRDAFAQTWDGPSPASADADLMRVDAPQVNEGERVHVIRLLDAPGATLTVTCPEWCVSDHADEKTRGTFAPDFTHRGEELVFPAPGGGETMLSAQITHAPFSSILREPVMGVSSASEDMGPDQAHEFADRLRAYADALDCLSVDLDDARLNARGPRGGDL